MQSPLSIPLVGEFWQPLNYGEEEMSKRQTGLFKNTFRNITHARRSSKEDNRTSRSLSVEMVATISKSMSKKAVAAKTGLEQYRKKRHVSMHERQ